MAKRRQINASRFIIQPRAGPLPPSFDSRAAAAAMDGLGPYVWEDLFVIFSKILYIFFITCKLFPFIVNRFVFHNILIRASYYMPEGTEATFHSNMPLKSTMISGLLISGVQSSAPGGLRDAGGGSGRPCERNKNTNKPTNNTIRHTN